MNLRFDFNNISNQNITQSSEDTSVSLQAQFHQPSTATGKTEIELREHVQRIGGFEAEEIDSETIRIITSF